MPEAQESTFDMDSAVNDIGSSLGFGDGDHVSDDEPLEDDVADVELDAAQDTDTPADTPEETETAVEEIPAPKSWAKETHELWKQLSPEAKAQVNLREKQALDGLSQYKENNDFGKAMRDVFTPYKAMIQSQGVDEVKAAQFLLNAHYRLSSGSPQERQAYFAQLAQSYGIEQQAAAAATEIDPLIKGLSEQVEQIRSTMTQREQADLSAARARVSQEVSAFADTAPYFDEVADDIAIMIKGGADLKTAYDKAVWANPVTRAKEQARLQKEAEVSMRSKAKTEADAARKATSTNVRTRDTGRSPTETVAKLFSSEHEAEMRETVRKANTRTH